ncbi:Thyrotropin-releasing hormone-degrading ectoenzyme [Liparis tanakae]|uniref:Thyrotropin-releasing hormone-degrading ectoenzyme n=1 Tax=Liparis tanakae TaxID=230148 RepID=A0A4Z2EU26_9TELE|nr:Thyrotropin-releasing hormone-degrading ectoenzyme [Liparis tanakae]
MFLSDLMAALKIQVERIPKDLLAVPKHPYAAMENWGLSVFVEQKILLDAEVSSSSYQMEVTMVVVHEICHQVRKLLIIFFVKFYYSFLEISLLFGSVFVLFC